MKKAGTFFKSMFTKQATAPNQTSSGKKENKEEDSGSDDDLNVVMTNIPQQVASISDESTLLTQLSQSRLSHSADKSSLLFN